MRLNMEEGGANFIVCPRAQNTLATPLALWELYDDRFYLKMEMSAYKYAEWAIIVQEE